MSTKPDLYVLNAVLDDQAWLNLEGYVAKALASAKGTYAQFANGFWVFRIPQAAATILHLEARFATLRVPFVAAPVCSPLRCYATPEIEEALRAAHIDFSNLAI